MDTWLGFFELTGKVKKANEIENLIKVPLVRQPNTYTCGVAAVLSILGYYGKELSYDDLTKELKATDKNGVDHRDIIKFFKTNGFDVELQKGMLMSDLMGCIDESIPVIVCLQAWAQDSIVEAESWEHGHWAVVVGYDEENVYLMDPSTLGNYTYIPIDEFAQRWHDQDGEIRLRQAGIIVRGTKRFDAEALKKLE